MLEILEEARENRKRITL